MKRNWIIGCAAAAVFLAVVLPRALREEPFAQAVADAIVEIASPEVRDIRLTTGLVGTVEPETVVYVYPKASGEVTEVNIKAGQVVEAGQQICVIDTDQVESAKSALDSAQLALRQASEELSRQSVLYAGGGISEQAYRQYQDNVESAQISQSNLVCVISGQGNKIVSFSVTERIRDQLQEGDPITVEKDGEEYTGTIYEISTMADSDTGLFTAKARLDAAEDEYKLSTGSSVKLYVVSSSVEDALAVPTDAVYNEGGASYVYTYDSGTGTLHKVLVETGRQDAEWIEILSGLEGGESVVTTWSSELYEGTAVRIKESGTDKESAGAGENGETGGGSSTDAGEETAEEGRLES